MNKIQTSARLATTALLGLAPVRFARASAANHRKTSPLASMMLGCSKQKSNINMTDYACPQMGAHREGAALGRAEFTS
jgi:hypothetical protein